MARAAFFCFPGSGHVNPTLPLVEELVRRGELVDYYCSGPFRSAIERTVHAFARYRGFSMDSKRLTLLRAYSCLANSSRRRLSR